MMTIDSSIDHLRALIERQQTTHLWGKPYDITPRLVTNVFGDGKQLVYIGFVNIRPMYFAVRVDGAWQDLDSMAFRDHLDEIVEDILDEYAEVICECVHTHTSTCNPTSDCHCHDEDHSCYESASEITRDGCYWGALSLDA